MSKQQTKEFREPKQKPVKTDKVFREQKKGWIERLAFYFAQRVDMTSDTEYPPVGNVRRVIAYFIDFLLANLLACVPLCLIESLVNGGIDTTQDLRVVPLEYAYLIVALAFLVHIFYFVYIPLKVWPGQTPGKRFLDYKIAMMDGSDVTLKALLLRNVFSLLVIEGAAFFMTSYIIQLITLTIGMQAVPEVIAYIYYFTTMLSVLVTLTNRNRRMFHDYIGGTKTYKLPQTQEKYSTF